MNVTLIALWFVFAFFSFTQPVFALTSSSDITSFTSDTLNIITLISASAAVFFLVKGGYHYLTSVGHPEALEEAKRTIKNALIGLVVVLGAGIIISVFQGALTSPATTTTTNAIALTPVNTVKPADGLTQVLIDAVSSFMQNIVESATKPIVDGIIGYLTTTPSLLTNSVILKFWLVILGITDSLFVLVVALLGLQIMSSSTLGYDEIDLKSVLPRIGLAFLGANVSLFLADYVILTCNALVTAVLNATGGLTEAWIVNAINPASFLTGTTPLITLIFLLIFLVLSIVLLLLYISRLIMISLGAVLSPLVFLLWAIPKFADFAEASVKTYLVTVFVVFVHVVIIQLASSFLVLPESSTNSLISIAVAIGLFFTLLKVPSLMMQLVMYSSGRGMFRKIGGQIINVISTDNSLPETKAIAIKTPRKVVQA